MTRRMTYMQDQIGRIDWTSSGGASISGNRVNFSGAGKLSGNINVDFAPDEYEIIIRTNDSTDKYSPKAFIHVWINYKGGDTFKGTYPIVNGRINEEVSIGEMGERNVDFDLYPVNSIRVEIESKESMVVDELLLRKSTPDVVTEGDSIYRGDDGDYVYDGVVGDGATGNIGGGMGGMEYVRSVPVNHTNHHPSYAEMPSQEVDAYVDGYILEFEHFRRPDFGDPPSHDHPDGEFIDPDHAPPSWAPKPGFGGFGPEGPKLIRYLVANDGRIYINWNDGDMFYTTSTYIDAYQAVHGYNMFGDRWSLAGDSDFSGYSDGRFRYTGRERYIEVPHTIKNIDVTSYRRMFYESTIIRGVRSSNKTITNMNAMFSNTITPVLDLSGMDTEMVTDMSNMFSRSKAKDINMSGFNTANVNDMRFMFYYSEAESLDLSNYNTANVTDMSSMFEGSKAQHIDVSSFDTSQVENMELMFKGVTSGNKVIDISNFDMSSSESTRAMFNLYSGGDIILGDSAATTYNVLDMTGMFAGVNGSIVGIDKLNTTSVIEMELMFGGSNVDNIDLSSFDTRSVQNYREMFRGATADTLDLTSFSLYKSATFGSNLYRMFYQSEVNTIDLSSFQTDDNMYMVGMFEGTTATKGYARTQEDADRFNNAEVTGIPDHLTFTVK